MAQDFADRVRELRERRELSQNELAVASTIPPANLSRILSGERPLRMEHAVSIARALGITVIELTAGTTVEEVVAEWIPREEYEAIDRLPADAERDLELTRGELLANKAENT